MEDYMEVDNDLITDTLTLAEMADEVSAVEEDADESADSEAIDEVETEEPDITRQEAQRALNIVRRFMEKNYADPAILKHSDALDEAFYQERRRTQKQGKLTHCFSVV